MHKEYLETVKELTKVEKVNSDTVTLEELFADDSSVVSNNTYTIDSMVEMDY